MSVHGDADLKGLSVCFVLVIGYFLDVLLPAKKYFDIVSLK